MFRLVPLFALAAADWLSSSADPRRTRSQPAETEISPTTVRNLKLLWKFPFEERITAPVVLGPIFTHRGVKELVFVAGAGDNLYAIDADLAKLVWKRHFDVSTPAACKVGLTAAPVLSPYNGPAPEGDDPSTPRRSLFVLTSDGQLRTVRPADAKDLAVPVPFLPGESVAQDLSLAGNVISTYVTGGCARPKIGEWSIHLDTSTVAYRSGRAEPKSATWRDYSVDTAGQSIRFTRKSGALNFIRADLGMLQPPVIANGVAFTLIGTSLAAFDLETSDVLFQSAPTGPEAGRDSLAIANGHIYFIVGNTLYCYGFPFEI